MMRLVFGAVADNDVDLRVVGACQYLDIGASYSSSMTVGTRRSRASRMVGSIAPHHDVQELRMGKVDTVAVHARVSSKVWSG